MGHDPGRAVTTACRTCAQPRESRPEPRPSRPGSGRPARPPRGSGCYYSVGLRRAATPLSPLQALAWAPAASMDARRVRVRAGWNNPRGWARRVLWTRADSLQLCGRSAAYQRLEVLGGSCLGKPQVLCIWDKSGLRVIPARRAHPARGRFGDLSGLQDGWQRWVVQGHVCPRSTCAGGWTAAGTGGSPHCICGPPAVSVRPNPAVGTRRGAAALLGPWEFAL